ncbi:unnamed protein product, partial [Ectocarpus sp. 6 AP-2014]
QRRVAPLRPGSSIELFACCINGGDFGVRWFTKQRGDSFYTLAMTHAGQEVGGGSIHVSGLCVVGECLMKSGVPPLRSGRPAGRPRPRLTPRRTRFFPERRVYR